MGGNHLPATTSDAVVVTLMDDLKRRLKETAYGDVGLIFTVHDHVIVKYQRVDMIRCAMSGAEVEVRR